MINTAGQETIRPPYLPWTPTFLGHLTTSGPSHEVTQFRTQYSVLKYSQKSFLAPQSSSLDPEQFFAFSGNKRDERAGLGLPPQGVWQGLTYSRPFEYRQSRTHPALIVVSWALKAGAQVKGQKEEHSNMRDPLTDCSVSSSVWFAPVGERVAL